MVEISNADADRILCCIDIAIGYYSLSGRTPDVNRARLAGLLKKKIKRKLHKTSKHDKE